MRTTPPSLSLTVLLLSIAAPLNAQATRTWVSGTGDDTHSCSRTAPCATFARAFSQTAAGGEIVVLDSGDFGPLTITKSISITATGVEAGVDGTTADGGIFINAGQFDTVLLRGLHIYGGGTQGGIVFTTGTMLTVDNCTIKTATQPGISIATATPGAKTFITNTLVSDSRIGISVTPNFDAPNSVVLDHVNVVNSIIDGLEVITGATVKIQVTNSDFSLNGVGVNAGGAGVRMSLESTVISSNGIGLIVGPGGAVARLSNVNVWNNVLGFGVSGTLNSFGNNHTTGNLDGVQPTVNNHLSPL